MEKEVSKAQQTQSISRATQLSIVSNYKLNYLSIVCLSLILTPCIFGINKLIGVRLSTLLILVINFIPAIYVLFTVQLRSRFKKISAVGNLSRNIAISVAFIGFAFLVILSLWRASIQAESFSRLVLIPIIISLFLNLYTFKSTQPTREEIYACIKASLSSAPLFSLISICVDTVDGNIAHILSSALGNERLLSTAFFFGPNSAAIFYGFSIICAISMLTHRLSIFFLASIAVAALYFFAAQSTGMTSVLILCVFILIIGTKLANIISISGCVFWPASALVLFYLYAAVNGTFLGDYLVRSEGAALGVATGRPILWDTAFYILRNDIEILFYGLGFGNIAQTELATPLGFVFDSSSATELLLKNHGLHNAGLQIIFDMGLLGLLAYCSILYLSVAGVIRSRSTWILPVIMYCVFTGYNEAVATVYQPFVFICLVVILMLCAQLQKFEEVETQRKPHKRQVLPQSASSKR